MTVKELRELLDEAPDDMEVFIGGSTALGMFCFQPACVGDSGVVDFGEPEGDEQGHQETGFVLLPHGLGVAEGEEDDLEEDLTQLN